MTKVDERLDDLYRELPDGFVAGRNQMAKDLRGDGEREAADQVMSLRRPTAAAWLLNRVALTSPKRLTALAEIADQLAGAQARALEGADGDAAEWHAAAARAQAAIGDVLDEAERAAEVAGAPAGARTLELVGATLRAAIADPELRDRVVRGRLEREQSAATLGIPAAGAPAPKRSAKAKKQSDKAAKRREAEQARRELERLEAALAGAEAEAERGRTQAEQTAEALRKQKARLKETEREVADLKRQVKAAKRRGR